MNLETRGRNSGKVANTTSEGFTKYVSLAGASERMLVSTNERKSGPPRSFSTCSEPSF